MGGEPPFIQVQYSTTPRLHYYISQKKDAAPRKGSAAVKLSRQPLPSAGIIQTGSKGPPRERRSQPRTREAPPATDISSTLLLGGGKSQTYCLIPIGQTCAFPRSAPRRSGACIEFTPRFAGPTLHKARLCWCCSVRSPPAATVSQTLRAGVSAFIPQSSADWHFAGKSGLGAARLQQERWRRRALTPLFLHAAWRNTTPPVAIGRQSVSC